MNCSVWADTRQSRKNHRMADRQPLAGRKSGPSHRASYSHTVAHKDILARHTIRPARSPPQRRAESEIKIAEPEAAETETATPEEGSPEKEEIVEIIVEAGMKAETTEIPKSVEIARTKTVERGSCARGVARCSCGPGCRSTWASSSRTANERTRGGGSIQSRAKSGASSGARS